MNACPSDQNLGRWLDGGPEDEVDRGLTAHVEGCSRCQDVLERLTSLDGPAPTPPPGHAPDASGLGKLRHLLHAADPEDTLRTAPPNAPLLPGYEILGELGRGGMGVVYKARQLSPNRLVAVKMIRAGEGATAEELVRFGVEAETVARLQHPNIVQIYEVGVRQQRPYFALEFMAGGSLEARIAGRPQPARESARLVEAVARAIDYAHGQGVVHRDLKPQNVLLTPDGTPRVADFGLAKILHADLRLTRTGDVAGTPGYMAPEQARAESGGVGPPADIYALGAILYECLTGRPPFVAPTPLEVLRQVTDCDPVPPSRLTPGAPRDLETVCLKCLEKDPRKRYASAAALADDLRRFLDGRAVRARPVGLVGRGWRWCRRNPLLASALAAVVLTVAGAFAWIYEEERTAQTLAAENARLARQERAAREEIQDALSRTSAALKERDAAGRRAQAIYDHLILGMLEGADPRRKGGRSLTAQEVLDRAAADVGRAFAGDPDLEQALRGVLGKAYLKTGQPRKAAGQLTARVALCHRVYGAADRRTLTARADRTTALVECGNFAAALKESADLLPRLRSAPGVEDTVTLQVLENRAQSHRRLGQFAESRRLQEEVLQVRRRVQGPENPETLGSLSALAGLLVETGAPGEAHRLCEEQLPVCRRVLGPGHQTTLGLRSQYALALLELGRLAESQKECENLLPALRRTAGPDHPDTLNVVGNLAYVLLARRQCAAACPRFEECLPALRRQYGEEHPLVGKTATGYGVCLVALGRHKDAAALFEQLLPVQRRLKAGQNLLIALEFHGQALTQLGKHPQAERVFRELLAGRRKAFPAGHWLIGEGEALLGLCLVRQSRLAEAEPLLLAAHEALVRAKGAPLQPGAVQGIEMSLAALYDALGNPTRAAQWRDRANPTPGPPP